MHKKFDCIQWFVTYRIFLFSPIVKMAANSETFDRVVVMLSFNKLYILFYYIFSNINNSKTMKKSIEIALVRLVVGGRLITLNI